MKRILHLFIFLLLLSGGDLLGQKKYKQKSPKQQRKAQVEAQESRDGQMMEDLKEARDGHNSKQDKATQKRMKSTLKKHEKHNKKRKRFFLVRWFKK